MYLEKHEPSYLVVNRQDETIQPIVKYACFANRFNTNFNIHFSNNRSDTCQKCDQLQNMIKSETNEDAINELKSEKKYMYVKQNIHVYCSISGNSTVKELYSFEKVGSKLLLDQRFLNELYNRPIQLKQAKYNDVQKLSAKYVPNEHQWFYNNLQVLDPPNEQLSDSE